MKRNTAIPAICLLAVITACAIDAGVPTAPDEAAFLEELGRGIQHGITVVDEPQAVRAEDTRTKPDAGERAAEERRPQVVRTEKIEIEGERDLTVYFFEEPRTQP